MQMTPQQRNLMRQRENMRRQMITREADTAVRDSGLQLNPQERAQFESRYIQERQKVEQALRQQIEAERQKRIAGANSTAEKRVPDRSASQKSRRQTGGFAKVREIGP